MQPPRLRLLLQLLDDGPAQVSVGGGHDPVDASCLLLLKDAQEQEHEKRLRLAATLPALQHQHARGAVQHKVRLVPVQREAVVGVRRVNDARSRDSVHAGEARQVRIA